MSLIRRNFHSFFASRLRAPWKKLPGRTHRMGASNAWFAMRDLPAPPLSRHRRSGRRLEPRRASPDDRPERRAARLGVCVASSGGLD